MPLDSEVSDLLKADLVADHRARGGLTSLADRNCTQGLAVIQNTVIQQAASVADDAAIMSALRTSIYVPQKAQG